MSKRLLFATLAVALAASALAPFAGARSSGYYSPLIRIPSLGINQKAQRTLATGPVVYFYDGDTIGIAAHNVTPVAGYNGHGPFHGLRNLKKGDPIWVNHVLYRVSRKQVVRPNDTSVLDWNGVVLSACYPDHSAAWRYVVQAAPVA